MRKVVDSNFLQSSELRDYLSKSKKNYVVLTDYASMEAYKGDTISSIFKSMRILADYPKQVIVLKDTRTICGLSGRSLDREESMIDKKQTREFSLYCQRLLAAEHGEKWLQEQLSAHGRSADVQMDRMLADATTIAIGINDISKTYTNSELKKLRTCADYPDEIINKLRRHVLLMTAILFKNHPQTEEPPVTATLPNTFIFRSALCGYLSALEWIKVGGAKDCAAKKLRNDMVDINFSTYATYFDGLLSSDRKMTCIYEKATWLLQREFAIGSNLGRPAC